MIGRVYLDTSVISTIAALLYDDLKLDKIAI